MVRNLILSLIGVGIFVVIVGTLTKRTSPESPVIGTPTPAPLLKQITVGKTNLRAEVADTEEKRRLGLSGRASLGDGQGMLFVFDQKKVTPSFWMKDMVISIDIFWIADGKVAGVEKNVPPPEPGTTDENLHLYYPPKPIDYVLETNSGFSDSNNIKVGDPVNLE